MIERGTKVYLVDGLDLPVGTQTLGTVTYILNYNNIEREHLKRVRLQEKVSTTEENKLRKVQQKAKTPEQKDAAAIDIDHNTANHIVALSDLDRQFTTLLSKELVVVSFPTVLVTADQTELIVVDQGETEVEDEPEIDYSGFE
jgi:hypothetical protein